MESLALGPLVNLAGWLSVFAMVIISVARGWLIPKMTVDSLIAIMSERVSDLRSQKDDYKAALEASTESVRLLAEGQRELIEANRATYAAVQALRRVDDGTRA